MYKNKSGIAFPKIIFINAPLADIFIIVDQFIRHLPY